MTQFKKTDELFNPREDIAQAISILKRQFRKVSNAVNLHLTIVVPRSALHQIKGALDPDSHLYSSAWKHNFISFNGVLLVAEEDGDAGIKVALDYLQRRLYPIKQIDEPGEQEKSDV